MIQRSRTSAGRAPSRSRAGRRAAGRSRVPRPRLRSGSGGVEPASGSEMPGPASSTSQTSSPPVAHTRTTPCPSAVRDRVHRHLVRGEDGSRCRASGASPASSAAERTSSRACTQHAGKLERARSAGRGATGTRCSGSWRRAGCVIPAAGARSQTRRTSSSARDPRASGRRAGRSPPLRRRTALQRSVSGSAKRSGAVRLSTIQDSSSSSDSSWPGPSRRSRRTRAPAGRPGQEREVAVAGDEADVVDDELGGRRRVVEPGEDEHRRLLHRPADVDRLLLVRRAARGRAPLRRPRSPTRRLSTSPAAPSSVCSVTSTTVRRKLGSNSAGEASRSLPFNESTLHILVDPLVGSAHARRVAADYRRRTDGGEARE